jgi:hypothetical protein
MRREDVVPPNSQDGHSRYRVAGLRAESHSDALGYTAFRGAEINLRWADLVQGT